MENILVNGLIPKKAKHDFIVTNLHFNVAEFSNFLIEHKEYIAQNNGWLTVDILKSKKDADKFYGKITKLDKRAAVPASSHMPDREIAAKVEDDLPF
jgi:hypothetical protein